MFFRLTEDRKIENTINPYFDWERFGDPAVYVTLMIQGAWITVQSHNTCIVARPHVNRALADSGTLAAVPFRISSLKPSRSKPPIRPCENYQGKRIFFFSKKIITIFISSNPILKIIVICYLTIFFLLTCRRNILRKEADTILLSVISINKNLY